MFWHYFMVYKTSEGTLRARLTEYCLWVRFSRGAPYFWPCVTSFVNNYNTSSSFVFIWLRILAVYDVRVKTSTYLTMEDLRYIFVIIGEGASFIICHYHQMQYIWFSFKISQLNIFILRKKPRKRNQKCRYYYLELKLQQELMRMLSVLWLITTMQQQAAEHRRKLEIPMNEWMNEWRASPTIFASQSVRQIKKTL